jgi:peroxiredoxin
MIALGACLALVALVVLEGAFVVNLLRQNGRLLNRLETIEERLKAAGIAPAPAQQRAEAERGLSVGSPAPEFRLPGLYGETLTIGALRAAGKPIMLLFTDPNCGPCNALLPEIGRWQHDYAGQLTVALISNGDEDANRAKCAEHGLTNVLLQADREVSEAYGENGTPSAVVVYPDGRIGSSLASGADAIRLLLTRVIGMPSAVLEPTVHPAAAQNGGGDGTAAPSLSRESVPGIGEQAPAVKLPDVNGRTINLTGYRGSRTLLLFWNPACGFCQQMLDDLKGWEAAAPEDAPKLLVISTGSIEANRALGLNSPVLVDPDFSIASSFGANGTPMAVLVDEEGRIASDVAAGGQSVLALARPQGHLTGARS